MIDIEQIPNVAGIYRISCLANEKVYIGRSIHIQQRCVEHFQRLSYGSHTNKALQRDWVLYGGERFEFAVIELLESVRCSSREQYWLHKLRRCCPQRLYNRAGEIFTKDHPKYEEFQATWEKKRDRLGYK